MCAAIKAAVGNNIGWARFSQTMVDLGCLAKVLSWKGIPARNRFQLLQPASQRCDFLVVLLGTGGRKWEKVSSCIHPF